MSRESDLVERGQRIVRMRKAKGWSQGELARRAGIDRTRLGKWERGVHDPRLDDLTRLAEILGVEASLLVSGREPDRALTLSPGQQMELAMCWANLMRAMKPLLGAAGQPARSRKGTGP